MHIKNYSANPLDISYKEISSNYAQEWALPYITLDVSVTRVLPHSHLCHNPYDFIGLSCERPLWCPTWNLVLTKSCKFGWWTSAKNDWPPYDRPGSHLYFFLKIQHVHGQKDDRLPKV